MKSKFLSFFLSSPPSPPEPSKIHPVALRSTFPELEHLRLAGLQKLNESVLDLEVFCTIVQTLNDGLEDLRLESASGTLQALRDLERYGKLIRNPWAIAYNQRRERGAKTPKVFFEV